VRAALSITSIAAVALLLGAAPPPPPAGPHGPRERPRGTSAPAADVIDRVRGSPEVVRAHVLAAPTGSQRLYKVHIDRWIKGQGPGELLVDLGAQRPLTPEGAAELLFLVPARPGDGGHTDADRGVLTDIAERYEVPDSESARLDQALIDLVAGAPEDTVLQALTELSPRFSEQAATRLALRAQRDASSLAVAQTVAQSPKTNPQALMRLVSMLGSKLGPAILVPLSQKGDAAVRVAALESLGRIAANEPDHRAEAVAALQAGVADPDAKLKLAAALGLASAGQATALGPLEAVLAGSDAAARAEAVRGLGELAHLGNADAYDALVALKDDPDAEVRARAGHLAAEPGAKPAPHHPTYLPFLLGSGVVVVLLAALALRRRKAA
jgi:hypothetical protein